MRPLVFLCGSFFDENDNKDRRNILRKYISAQKIEIVSKKYIVEPFSIIIDNIFTEDELEKYNITLIEEIISACAYKNYVFVDTLSTALELGLFSNSYSNNRVTAMLPKDYKYFKPDIGYFVQETLKKSSNINLCEYTNKRINKCIKNECKVIENLIAFKDQELPEEIKKDVSGTFSNNVDDYSFTIGFSDNNENESLITYIIKDKEILFKVPANILFYLVNQHKLNIDKIKKDVLYEFGIYTHYEKIEYNIEYFLCLSGEKEVVLESSFKYNIDDVIDNMNLLIENIRKANKNYPKRYKLLKYEIREKMYDSNFRNLIGIYDLFGIDDKKKLIIKNLLKKTNKAVINKNIVIKGKNRKITMYSSNSEAYMLRKIHEELIIKLEKIIKLNSNCYAYRKNYSIKECVLRHKYSYYFLKLDIKDFFNSISKNKMKKIIRCSFCKEPLNTYIHLIKEKNKKYNSPYFNSLSDLNTLLDLFFFKNKLPLGFVSSPFLSNLYMNFFDQLVEQEFPSLIYTRYSDDILISSKYKFDVEKVKLFIENELSFIDLALNKRKVHTYKLADIGDHVKFLGLNIVKKDDTLNEITVGKKYIKEVCKNVSLFVNDNSTTLDFEEILGQIQYIKSISTKDYEIFKDLYYIKNYKNFNLNNLKSCFNDK